MKTPLSVRFEKRPQALRSKVGIYGDRIGSVPIEDFDRVSLGSCAHVTSFCIEDDRHTGMTVVDVVDQRRQFPLRPQSAEMRDLRFERADQVGDCIDDRRQNARAPSAPSNPAGIMSGNGSSPTQTSDVLFCSQVLSCSAKEARSMMFGGRLKRREYIGDGDKFRHLPPNSGPGKLGYATL